MSAGITLKELLVWNDEASVFWKTLFDVNPSLLELNCDIDQTTNVQGLVRHIWAVELRWAQRLAGLPVLDRDKAPMGPLDALFQLHREAMEIFRNLLAAPDPEWDAIYTLDITSLGPELRTPTRRKVAAHAMFHCHRHWAQLATLLRQAGFPAGFRGDLLFTAALH